MKNYTDKNLYIQEVILPFLNGDKDRPISSVCYNLDGNIIFASNVFARSFGYQSNEDVIGRNILDIQPSNDCEYILQVEKIRKLVIKKQESMFHINFLGFSYGFDSRGVLSFPLFMPNGEIVATNSISKQFNWFNPSECFNKLMDLKTDFRPQTTEIEQKIIEVLTPKEYELLFLFSIGLTHDEVAKFMSMSRSNVTKLFNTKIIDALFKIGVTPQDVFESLSIRPESLKRPRAIIFNSSSDIY